MSDYSLFSSNSIADLANEGIAGSNWLSAHKEPTIRFQVVQSSLSGSCHNVQGHKELPTIVAFHKSIECLTNLKPVKACLDRPIRTQCCSMPMQMQAQILE